jgi:uncharacterized protein YjbI with pentapeptide repeats
MNGVKLNNANLMQADLTGATGLSEKELSRVMSLKGAKDPNGEVIDG